MVDCHGSVADHDAREDNRARVTGINGSSRGHEIIDSPVTGIAANRIESLIYGALHRHLQSPAPGSRGRKQLDEHKEQGDEMQVVPFPTRNPPASPYRMRKPI